MDILSNIESIRADFPILTQSVHNRPLVYLDNAATTQKPWSVIQKIEEGYTKQNANVHRGVHFLSQMATEAHEAARVTVQQFLGAAHAHEIIFTRGTTESINLVAASFGETFLKQGDEVIVSEMEHHSNIVPWQLLQQRKGIIIKVIPFNEAGELDLQAYASLFSDRTKLVAVNHHPIAAQIFGHEPEVMAEAAKIALDISGADFIDINMGCPVGKVVKSGDGSALMRTPQLAGEIINAVSNAVPVPVTVKFRKGWDSGNVNAVEFGKMAEAAGAAAIAVHGRTRVQMYSGDYDD